MNSAVTVAANAAVTAPINAALKAGRGPAAQLLGACVVATSLLAAPAASADTFRFTSAGTYDGSAPSSFFTEPGGAWAMAFDFDPGLVPVLPELGQYFAVGFWNFSLTLNGVAVLQQPASVAFYNGTTNSGGVDIFFNDAIFDPTAPAFGFQFYGPQVYSGTEFAPTMLPGTYTTFLPGFTGFELVINDVSYTQPVAQFTITAIPLPPTLLLGLAGLGMIGVVARRRRTN